MNLEDRVCAVEELRQERATDLLVAGVRLEAHAEATSAEHLLHVQLLTDLLAMGISSIESTRQHCPKCGALLPPLMSTDMEGAAWIPAGVLWNDDAVSRCAYGEETAMIHVSCYAAAVPIPEDQHQVAGGSSEPLSDGNPRT